GMSGAEPEQVVRRPVMLQRWSTMTFLHWAYDPAIVRPLVPAELALDLYDDVAWVGLTAFEMADVRLPGLPAVPGLSTFPETNVRTYVRGPDGRDGLWFLSLDATSLPTVLGGRAAFGVPYHWAAMSVERGETVCYRSRRRYRPAAGSDLAIAPGTTYASTELSRFDHFLTGRWRAYGALPGLLTRTSVEHQPWPLRRADVRRLDQTLTAVAGLPDPTGEPVVHYSRGVDVRLAAPRLFRRRPPTSPAVGGRAPRTSLR
ncbi:MAG: YqjF family protein, partial [Mycobacteriales bacterium]